jgi:CO/xanthine dehydrogenase Mo-binding subunit
MYLVREIEKVAVGEPVERIDARLVVTGKAKFGYDFELPGMLYGKIKHAEVPHAKILKVDVSRALRLSGVRCAITGRDIPIGLRGIALFDTPTLAVDRVRYYGEPIAAVAADTLEVAEKALEYVDFQYEELPAVFDPEEAMLPEAPVLHPDYERYGRPRVHGARSPPGYKNISNYHRVVLGDVEKGFEKSDIIVENKYEVGSAHVTHIEPNTCVCYFDPVTEVLNVYTSTQSPIRMRHELALALNMPENKIRVVGLRTGGGFGNKLTVSCEAICAVLALKTGRPVKITLTREEVFYFTTVRHAGKVWIKDGVSRDGRIISRYVKAVYNGGAYSGGSGIVTIRNAAFALATYKAENLLFEGFRVYTNLPPGGAFRGFGTPQIDFAVEQQMDIIAEKLGMDPVEFRLKNIVRQGEVDIFGEACEDVDRAKVLMECAKAIEWSRGRREGSGRWRRGKGIALIDKYSYAPVASSAMVKLREDGVVEVFTPAVEIGTGVHTIIKQIVAEEFGVPLEKVELVCVGDTALSPFDEGAFSSRVTVAHGNALLQACRKLKEKIKEYAARILGEEAENLDVRGGYVVSRRDEGKKIKVEDLFSRGRVRTGTFLEEEGVFVAASTWFSGGGHLDPETGRLYDKEGRMISQKAVNYYYTSAVGAEVEVDIETGKIKLLKVVNVVDCGRPINPRNVLSQVIGCTVMGISTTLYEECVWDKGYPLNPDFKDYKIVTCSDLPEIVPIIVETPLSHGPYGAKGIGEAIGAVAPAIANAIYDAIGVRINKIPITSEEILKSLGKVR